MTLLPRSLLWRTMLLLAVLMVAGQFAWLQIFRATEREPRAFQIAQQISSVVNLTRSALITADPAKRIDLLRDLSQQESIQVYADAPNVPVEPLSGRALTQLVAAELKRRLGPGTQLLGSREGVRSIWVNFEIDGQTYWVRLTRERIERAEQLRWIGWGALILLLSVGGAFLIVTRINRPLRELARATAAIGRGETPQAVAEESGPAEIRTLARAFNQMTNDLKRIDADRALLLAGVSHDLRTPLARIRLGVEMLGDKADATLIDGMVQDIEDIDAAINQFLDFARVTGEQSAASEVDLEELVHSVVERYQQQGKPVRARFTGVPQLQMKVLAIRRLLTNLIDNALRHGGTEVEVQTAVSDGWVRLSILDRGPGIPSADTARMLQPFTRLNEARSTSGSGLGLAIVDRIAKLHGGRVSLLAREGGGLEARIEFPVARGRAQSQS
ncbi:MAG TPA: ATP-binding protein [Burkholderiales bacterium]|jgi:two-component system osmolarity sensor histidine kinase EnvZ|nr:ATP-binding protein [Burkholderiales bacterium]